MTQYKPEDYAITVSQETIDGDQLFVGRVAEFPNLTSYEDTYDEAYEFCFDGIECLIKMANEENKEIPVPNKFK